MTDQRLRDLLHEHVADLQATDLAATAWRDAGRTRRRAAVVAGAAVVALVVAGVLVVRPGGDVEPVRPARSPSADASTAIPAAVVEQGSDYRGATTWWAPPASAEAGLPDLGALPFPHEISLAPDLPAHPPGVLAHAVYEVSGDGAGPGRAVVVGHDGSTYSLDLGLLDRVTDEEGNTLRPLTQESLAPSGRHVFFIQNSSLEVYDLTAGDWTRYETVPWLAESARWISATEIWSPGELGAPDGPGTTYDVTGAEPASVPTSPRVWDTSDEPYGPVRESEGGGVAQATYLAESAAGPGGEAQSLDAVAARNRGSADVHLLVMPGQDDDRWKGCCPVIGWLDDETVLLQSRSNTSRILAWRVGTAELWRVSVLTGWVPGEEVPVGSFADPR